MTTPIRIAVLGASGYTGADLVRLALTHPNIEIAALSANAKAGLTMAEVWPHFAPYPGLPRLTRAEDVDYAGIDAVFGCLPHAASAALLSTLTGPKIIDLSADFRLKDATTYAEWYGRRAPGPGPARGGGVRPDRIRAPGAGRGTAGRLPRLLSDRGAARRAAAGRGRADRPGEGQRPTRCRASSGAGRSLKEANLFPEVAEAVHPYAIGAHRHMPEIEQEIAARSGTKVRISFTPHLVPVNRGELVTIAVELRDGSVADLRAALLARYIDEPFVHLLPEGVAPATRMVRGSNHAVINIFADRIPGRALVIAAIDNLVKGSSGQAIQNFNLMFGLSETSGLLQAPLFP